ncbi:hypothetical protein [Pseudarthrobacter sp. NBSH8]|uniref:PKD domain-containing protein n=1 Tax=Pseudarthrobacter sp. NBSH8 TaxID=2596911 RepID=UPI002104AAE1|nr:hypothetical protein [Pseudarthrobacter sp. NBSH8]
MKKIARCGLLMLFVILLHVPTVSPARAEASVKGDWGGAGANVGGWYQHPGSGAWTETPIGVDDDPYVYMYKHVCRADPTLDGSNCAGPDIACTAGDDGRSVNWYRSLAEFTPRVWSFFAGPTCIYNEKPVDVLEQIAAQIQQQFESLPINAGAVVAQPSPNTLRGAETNFYADASEQQFDVTMFGQRVHVVATPVQYTWNYGDGTVFGPQPSMGGPLPQDRWGEKTRTSHVYADTGDFQVVLTTSFHGTYSVNNGPPLPIPGQGQFSAPPQTISVWRSITRNYADDCNQNPQGQGCPGVASPR